MTTTGHKKSVSQVVLQALRALTKYQDARGYFPSYSWSEDKTKPRIKTWSTVFSTALILDALVELPDTPLCKTLKQSATAFLLEQKSSHWSFNYWDRRSPEYRQHPYPDDWDDTACSLATLTRVKPELIRAQVLGKVVRGLTACEVAAGGPYQTWLISSPTDNRWQDCDHIVNTNIAYFLSLHGVQLPNLTQLIESQIQQQHWTSPYYPTPYPFFYFLSKWYQGPSVPKLIDTLSSWEVHPHDWGNPLNTALVLSALCRWRAPLKKLQPIYLTVVNQFSNWEAAPFYQGVNPNQDQPFMAGSPALTTALCLEAIHLYHRQVQLTPTPSTQGASTVDTSVQQWHSQIIDQATHLFDSEPDLLANFSHWVTRITQHDPQHHITLLPWIFAQTLSPSTTHFSHSFYQQLGLANLLGWIAYTIYDNFLDEEADPADLPLANVCLRLLTRLFESALPAETGFADLFHRVMTQLEAANLWEVTQTRLKRHHSHWQLPKKIPRYPGYRQLAQKSMAHALGPMAVMMGQGQSFSSPFGQAVWQFFTHYLIVRQLNDDLHDWKSDLERGHLNAVSAHLLRQSSFKQIGIREIQELEKRFWLSEIDIIAHDIRRHVKLGKKALKRAPVIAHPQVWSELLDTYLRAVATALEQRDQTVTFWHSYQAHN